MIGYSEELRILMRKMAELGPFISGSIRKEKGKIDFKFKKGICACSPPLNYDWSLNLDATCPACLIPFKEHVQFKKKSVMTDKEVLKKAIEIINKGSVYHVYVEDEYLVNNYHSIIFSNNFAKAFFWSEEQHKDESVVNPAWNKTKYLHWWEWNMMEMVRQENPIDYLRKFI